MSEIDTTGWITCDVCHYSHAPDTGCPNPACLANPALSDATRELITQRIAEHYEQQAADEERRRLYGLSFKSRGTS